MPLIEVQDLKVHFPVLGGLMRHKVGEVRAVDGVSFAIEPGKTVGLVGESGSGKTTVGRAIIKLIPATSGTVLYRNKSLLPLSEKEFRPLRSKLQIIFQDPFGSLNPRMTCGDIISEAMEIHFPSMTRADRAAEVRRLLETVGLTAAMAMRYPHEFSGGQRQRIGIARALAVNPEFIVCDEPVSALDVSVQAQIVNLLRDLQQSRGIAYLFIAHDLAVVEHISDRVLVMNRGKIVEQGTPEQIYNDPQDPYTRALLAAVPKL